MGVVGPEAVLWWPGTDGVPTRSVGCVRRLADTYTLQTTYSGMHQRAGHR
jgi:hypothetical protein